MKKSRDILKYFSLDIEATRVAQLTGLNSNTVNKCFTSSSKTLAKPPIRAKQTIAHKRKSHAEGGFKFQRANPNI